MKKKAFNKFLKSLPKAKIRKDKKMVKEIIKRVLEIAENEKNY